jgi:replication initiation protein RepC
LDVVLRRCPDIQDYGLSPIKTWRDLWDAGIVVARFLGISQSAYSDSISFLGVEKTSAVIAWILQRSEKIRSAGGYLRFLLQKAKSGSFSVSQLLLSEPAE